MRYRVFWRVIKVREIDKLYLNYLKELTNFIRIALRKWFIVKYSTAHQLLMFIVTFCIILNLNQVKSSMIHSHKQQFVDQIFCNKHMLKNDNADNLYSRIQLTPNIFIGKVIKKVYIPDKIQNWKMIALVRVKSVLRDIYTPNMLRVDSVIWIGPVSDVINQLCMSPVKTNSSYVFFGTQLANSMTTFQVLFRPVEFSENFMEKFEKTRKRKVEELSINSITQKSSNKTVIVTCNVSGYPRSIVYWVKNWQAPTSIKIRYRISRSYSQIIMSNIGEADAGIYTCYAENIYGYTTKKFYVMDKNKNEDNCSGTKSYCHNQGYCKKSTNHCLCKPGYVGRRCQYSILTMPH